MKPLYEKAVKEAKAADTKEVRRGVGLAWGGYNVGLGSDDFSNVAIELTADGKFIKYDTWQDQGQGGDQGAPEGRVQASRDLSNVQADGALKRGSVEWGLRDHDRLTSIASLDPILRRMS